MLSFVGSANALVFNGAVRAPSTARAAVSMAESVWIDGDLTCRSKTRTLDANKVTTAEKLPLWNYDGSSTGQAPGDDSEVIIHPKAIYPDPFRGGDNILVLCDTYTR